MHHSNGQRIPPSIKRRLVILAVSSFASCIFFSYPKWTIYRPDYVPDYEFSVVELPTVTVTVHSPESTATDNVLDKFSVLNGVAASFRDALQPETKYITSWPVKEWGYQVIAITNLIYLALITERVPILPPFSFLHHKGSARDLDFGDVFDIERLQKALDYPVLEWYQVKDPQSQAVDILGCWSTMNETARSHSSNLRFDISYTPTPDWTKRQFDGDEYSDLWSLASLAFHDTDVQLSNTQLSPILGIASAPGHHLFCLDDLSQVSVRDLLDYHQEMSPAWRFVGQHMHWTPRIQSIANQYIRRAFSLDPTEAIPPYVAIHVQHSDWRSWCDRPVDECFAPLSAYARKVQEIKAEIQRSKGITVDRVLMTSDEKGSLWWDAVRKRKWVRLDHSETTKRYGAWYTVLIDEVVASGAVGFVATDRPITSVLAARRVASWQHGVVRSLPWETKRRKPLEATDAQVERERRA